MTFENEEITEYHTCDTCQHHWTVPTDPHFRSWECACKKKSDYVNSQGGLTRCQLWEEQKIGGKLE